jgi:signal transduction histidine kinase/ligand-binding sensor domain-containing protein
VHNWPHSRAMQTKLLCCFIGVSLWAFCVDQPASAVNPEIHISQYAHTAWRMQDGVFATKPNSIAQTSDGYLWIGTGEGLLRFDGVRFSPWAAHKGQKLPNSFIWSLLAARDGTLWIGTKGGLAHLVNGELIDFPDTRAAVLSILQDRSGTIWFTRAHVATTDKDGPLCEVVGLRIQCFGARDGIPDPDADPMAEDYHGAFWIGGSSMLTRWEPGSVANYAQGGPGGQKFLDSIEAIDPVADGSVWVGSFRSGKGLGLQRFFRGTWKPLVLGKLDSSTLKVAALHLDAGNSLWIGTMDKGIYRVHDREVEHFGSADGLSSDAVYNFFEDREGDLWTITSEGIDRFREFPIATFSLREGLTAAKAGSVVAARDGSIWIGNYYAVDILREGKISSLGRREGLPGQKVTSLLEDHDGRMWVGIDDRLTVYENGRFHPLDLAGGRHIGLVGAMTEDSDGNIWVVTDKTHTGRLYRVRDFEVREEAFPPGFPGVYSLAADSQSGVWLGLRSGDLARYRHRILEPYVERHSATYRPLLSIITSREGNVFAIQSNELLELQNRTWKTLGSANGLPCNLIYSIVEDAQGDIFLYMKCGLVSISSSELQRWWGAPSTKVKTQYLDAADGARTDQSYFSPTAARSPDGRLWFAGSRVLQMIDPSNQHLNSLPPPVHIEQLIADRRGKSVQNTRLPALTRDIQIDYTALSFVMPQRVLFRYKLDGHDKEWQDAGSRRSAFYTNLNPGAYTFHVIACNNDGVWNEQGADLSFSIAMAWYQTILFKIVVYSAAFFAGYYLYRLKIARQGALIKARFDERLEERTRLARDLHDTLLQTIHGSRLVADELLTEPADSAQTQLALTRLAAWLDRATQEGRAALESLRISKSHDLVALFRDAAEECHSKRSVESTVHLVGCCKDMHPLVRNEVYRIGYEAVQNACIHSGGNWLKIILEYSHDFTLRVQDNGCRIDPEILRIGKPGHFGLIGMHERAVRIGAVLSFEDLPDCGTEVRLVVPGRMIFTKSRTNRFGTS